ncbi:MAG: autotransporter-associated beta strand repeat-containing protein [Limisphaerales bacterium]
MKISFLISLALVTSFLTLPVMATVYYWDPEGTATPSAANLAGAWNTNSGWSTSSAQSASPVAFSSGVAACFCAGSTAVTTPFAVNVNSAISIAGIFNGSLNPPGFFVTLSGSGSLNLVAGADAFDTSGSDGGTTTVAVPLTGPGQAVFEGGGNTYFNAPNTFSGGTALGYVGLPSFVGTLFFNNGSAFGTGPITMTTSSSCQLAVEGTAALTVTNAFTAANVNLLLSANSAGLTLSGPWNLGATPLLDIAGSGQLVTISGTMSGVGGVVKSGPGTLALTGANSFTGGAIISNGVLSVIADDNFGTAAGTPTLNISLAGGTLTANTSFAINSNRLVSLNGNSTISVSSGNTLTYGGNITGSASLTKTGAGTLVLSGNNGYSGTTTISSGTLEADSQTGNSVGAGSVIMQAGGTLSGSGYVSGAVSGAGNIEPGTVSGAATLSLANGLDLSAGGTFVWNLASNSTSASFPAISVSAGNLNLGGNSKLSINFKGLASAPATNNSFWLTQEEWPIVSLNGSAANSGKTQFADLLNGSHAAGNFTNYADAVGNINLLYLPSSSVFDALYDSGPGFFSGENLILTNFSGLSLYVWSSTDAGLSVSNWAQVGQMAEQPLAPALPGYSRYSINVVPTVSPTFYVAGNFNTGPYLSSPVPVCLLTTPDFSTFTVTNIDTSISASGVLGLLPPPPVMMPGNTDANGQFQLQFSAATNLAYVIQASTDLVTWTNLSSGTVSSSPVTFVDPNATNPSEFYRVVLQSPY